MHFSDISMTALQKVQASLAIETTPNSKIAQKILLQHCFLFLGLVSTVISAFFMSRSALLIKQASLTKESKPRITKRCCVANTSNKENSTQAAFSAAAPGLLGWVGGRSAGRKRRSASGPYFESHCSRLPIVGDYLRCRTRKHIFFSKLDGPADCHLKTYVSSNSGFKLKVRSKDQGDRKIREPYLKILM